MPWLASCLYSCVSERKRLCLDSVTAICCIFFKNYKWKLRWSNIQLQAISLTLQAPAWRAVGLSDRYSHVTDGSPLSSFRCRRRWRFTILHVASQSTTLLQSLGYSSCHLDHTHRHDRRPIPPGCFLYVPSGWFRLRCHLWKCDRGRRDRCDGKRERPCRYSSRTERDL